MVSEIQKFHSLKYKTQDLQLIDQCSPGKKMNKRITKTILKKSLRYTEHLYNSL